MEHTSITGHVEAQVGSEVRVACWTVLSKGFVVSSFIKSEGTWGISYIPNSAGWTSLNQELWGISKALTAVDRSKPCIIYLADPSAIVTIHNWAKGLKTTGVSKSPPIKILETTLREWPSLDVRAFTLKHKCIQQLNSLTNFGEALARNYLTREQLNNKVTPVLKVAFKYLPKGS